MGTRTYTLEELGLNETELGQGFLTIDQEAYPSAKKVSTLTLRTPRKIPVISRNTNYTATVTDHGKLQKFDAAGCTYTLPGAVTLGEGWTQYVYADGFAVTVARTGGASNVLASGDVMQLTVFDGKVNFWKFTPQVL